MYIYIIDEKSLKWNIVNTFINDKYKNNFVILDWNSSYSSINIITLIYCNGKIHTIYLDDNILLKIKRKFKIDKINIDDNYSYDKKSKLNYLRFDFMYKKALKYKNIEDEQLAITCQFIHHKNIETKKEKRKKLAKKYRGLSKTKNK